MKKSDKELVQYYTDELNDDFMDNGFKKVTIPDDYKFKRTNKFNIFISGWFYYCVAKPILRMVCYFSGVRYENIKYLKQFRKEGCFIYSNHTNVFDMFAIQGAVVRYKRTNIIGLADTAGVPVLRNIVRALGYIPIPESFKALRNFQDAIDYYIEKGQDILIYPEAHIWPYYNKIRPFKSVSFRYPAKSNAPVIPIVTVYRKSKLFKKPRITYVIGEAIRPKEGLNVSENKEYLRDECYKQMCEIVEKYNSYEYIKYIKKEENN